jgi:Ca2+-binding RTX toxin-like protein
MLSRGVRGLRGAPTGTATAATVRADATSALIPGGHRVLVWVTAGDSTFYKPYPGSAGGVLAAGEASTVTLPFREGGPGGGPCATETLGTRKRDKIDGTPGGELIRARRGNDRVRAREGDDCVKGNGGRDRLKGNAGADVVTGGTGNDRLSGGTGDDKLKARRGGRDVVRCGKGKDKAAVDRRDTVRGCEKVRRRR